MATKKKFTLTQQPIYCQQDGETEGDFALFWQYLNFDKFYTKGKCKGKRKLIAFANLIGRSHQHIKNISGSNCWTPRAEAFDKDKAQGVLNMENPAKEPKVENNPAPLAQDTPADDAPADEVKEPDATSGDISENDNPPAPVENLEVNNGNDSDTEVEPSEGNDAPADDGGKVPKIGNLENAESAITLTQKPIQFEGFSELLEDDEEPIFDSCFKTRIQQIAELPPEEILEKIDFWGNIQKLSTIQLGMLFIGLKEKTKHGDFLKLLEERGYKKSTVNNYVNIASRYGGFSDLEKLTYAQYLKLLTLPKGEEKNFVVAIQNAGVDLENQSTKDTADLVAEYKQKFLDADKRAAKAEKILQEQQTTLFDLTKAKEGVESKVKGLEKELKDERATSNDRKKRLDALQQENAKITNDLERERNKPAEIKEVSPADYDTTKNELFELKQNFNLEVEKGVNAKLTETQKAAEEKATLKLHFDELMAKVRILADNIDAVKAAVAATDRAAAAEALNDLSKKICW